MEIYIAGAGAGKTTTMANNIIKLREEIEEYKIIFCITFTNNATSCIKSKLINYYGVIPKNILVSTIHSFLYQVRYWKLPGNLCSDKKNLYF